VSDYGLDDQAIEVRSPAWAEDFFSNLCVQTGSGAHPASCTMGTGGPLPEAKRGRGMTLTTHPHLVPRSRISRSYTSSPSKRHHGVLFFTQTISLCLIQFQILPMSLELTSCVKAKFKSKDDKASPCSDHFFVSFLSFISCAF
jgi:hypothetical protein